MSEADRDGHDASQAGEATDQGEAGRPSPTWVSATRAVERAREQLALLTGKGADSVSGLERSDEGWHMTVEMVELERIPPSTSVLATYEADLDPEGNLLEYQRARRYYRNQADES